MHILRKNKLIFISQYLLIGLLVLINSVAYAITPKDTLVIAYRIDEMITLDPAAMFEFSALEYANNTYERLLGYDTKGTGKIVGIIANDWKISKDGKTYTFTIHNDLKFASGDPITADDVVFSLQRAIILNKAPSAILSQFGFTKDNVLTMIKVISPYVLQLQVNEVFAPNLVLNCLTNPVASIVNKKEVLAHQDNNDLGNKWLSTHHAGSGPFKLNKWAANEMLYLEKNTYFKGPVSIDKVIIRHVSESATQKLLLEKNDVDIARNLQPNNIEELGQQIQLIKYLKDNLICLCLNQNNQYLKHKEVRQAIKFLVDYQSIKDNLLKDKAEVHQSFIPLGFFAASNRNPFSFRLNKAKKLLKQVGLTDGFTISLDAKNILLAQAMQASLAQAGIKVSIIPGDSKQVLTKFRERNYDAILTTWATDYKDPHANAVSFTRNPDNSEQGVEKTLAWRAAWDIPELTKLTTQAAKELNINKRKAIYTNIQRQFFMDSPIVVLFQEMEVYAVHKQASFKLGLDTGARTYTLCY
jgi:peptide/nickel transport system substrate-binding protein